MPETAVSKLVVLNVSELFGEAVKRIHEGNSIVELVEIWSLASYAGNDRS